MKVCLSNNTHRIFLVFQALFTFLRISIIYESASLWSDLASHVGLHSSILQALGRSLIQKCAWTVLVLSMTSDFLRCLTTFHATSPSCGFSCSFSTFANLFLIWPIFTSAVQIPLPTFASFPRIHYPRSSSNFNMSLIFANLCDEKKPVVSTVLLNSLTAVSASLMRLNETTMNATWVRKNFYYWFCPFLIRITSPSHFFILMLSRRWKNSVVVEDLPHQSNRLISWGGDESW